MNLYVIPPHPPPLSIWRTLPAPTSPWSPRGGCRAGPRRRGATPAGWSPTQPPGRPPVTPVHPHTIITWVVQNLIRMGHYAGTTNYIPLTFALI